MEAAVVADPTTVLPINTGHVQVSSLPTSSEPTTPSSDSPLSLDGHLREWLQEVALSAGSTNPKVYTKLLVSNAAAGSVIGKAGSNINDVQAKTFARIQLSKANEYFPGTTERTLLVTGRLKQVVAALDLLFAKLLREGVAPLSPKSKAAAAFPRPGSRLPGEESMEAPRAPHLLVRLLVPQPLCGVIIGKHGSTIRNYAADTNTVIRVTSSEASHAPTSHRIVTIAGEQEGVLKAIALMVLKQSDDPNFTLYGELPPPALPGMLPRSAYAAAALPASSPYVAHHTPAHFLPGAAGMVGSPDVGAAPLFGGGMPAFGLHPGLSGGAPMGADSFTSVSLMLTEDQAAVLLDQGSRPVMEVEQMAGCRARLEMVDGPRGAFGRLLLTGPPDSITYAQWLLGQQLAAAASYQLGGTTYYSPTPAGGFMVAPPPAFLAPPPPWQQQPQQHMMDGLAGMMPLRDEEVAAGLLGA